MGMVGEQKINPFTPEYFMRQALLEAQKAMDADEVPIGAVVVLENKIIGRGYNQSQILQDATAHAEMIALTAATQYLGNKYLFNATLYVTAEPCMMCTGAIFWSKISKIIYGVSDEKSGFLLNQHQKLIKHTSIEGPLMEEECKTLMQKFFKKKR